MPDPAGYMWLIPLLPLAASALTAILGPRLLRGQSHWPCIVAVAASCVLSFLALASVETRSIRSVLYTWAPIGHLNLEVAFRLDGLTAVMLVMVTFVGSLIAIYSAGYMRGDPGYPRYFACVALFIFSMTGLVMADNFVLLYAFWEGVGLCSYLLIGFWYAKPSAAAAARKAFLVTRIGDVGLILGIILLWSAFQYPFEPPGKYPGAVLASDTTSYHTHYSHALDFETVFAAAKLQHPGLLTAVCLLLFCGAVGKSAQFPLHVWLPDAMEGPSPVSALIHAATMVTAGVYLVARCMPLFVAAPPMVLLTVAVIGGFTALLAALIALTQNDLKRVLAYSTISQLGYMFLALGCGATDKLVAFAVIAAIFHLVTHAFFKALLFLAAGSVMHAMGNVIDMRRFGGLRRILKHTHWTFLCGAAALAGVPLLSGFWSKDEILDAAFQAGTEASPYRVIHWGLLVAGLVTAGLTAFYTSRAYFRTFWGEEKIPHEAGHHAHESPWVMLVPMMVLAVGAVFLGLLIGPPFSYWLPNYLEHHWIAGGAGFPHVPGKHEHSLNWPLMGLSSVIALGGIGAAWWMYCKQPGLADRLAANLQGLYQLSLNKFHLDEIYSALVVMPAVLFAQGSRILDTYLIDGLVELVGQCPRWFGQLLRPIQNGLLQFYALTMLAGLVVLLLALAFRWAM